MLKLDAKLKNKELGYCNITNLMWCKLTITNHECRIIPAIGFIVTIYIMYRHTDMPRTRYRLNPVDQKVPLSFSICYERFYMLSI